jgi:K+-transporting ATPase ATPase C chain
VPIDLVTTSGSGLDPDITPDSAYYQAHRVALARHLSDDTVNKLIAAHVTPRTLGLLGEPRVSGSGLDRLANQERRFWSPERVAR